MHPEADLTLRGQASLVAEFVSALDLHDVTLCFNDWAAPQILVADGLTDRIGGMVLAACETAGNYPPGLAGRNLALLGALPGGIAAALQALRLRKLRQTPLTFGWMAKHGIPEEMLERWLAPATADKRVRRDLQKYIGSTRQGRRDLIQASEKLGRFTGPVRVVWAADDRLMPQEEGRRLASAFPAGEFVLIDDSYTLIPLDQPKRLAEEIRKVAAQVRPS
jgi:pimeloyl-ACP methyl ester carboxylesterase